MWCRGCGGVGKGWGRGRVEVEEGGVREGVGQREG